MRELAETDACAVAVAGDAKIDEIAVGEVGAGQHARHAAVRGIEAVALAEEIVRRLGRTADTGNLGNLMRLDIELETGLDQRRADRVMPAPSAQGRDAAFVVAMREAELVLGKTGMMQLGLGDVGHSAASLRV